MTLCGLHFFETETEMETFDVAIVGGGPAGSSCAAFCALGELRTLVLEREKFPREKVCGDCLNPSCWPVLDRLNLTQQVRALPHARLDFVEFIAVGGRKVIVDLPSGDECEFAVKRSVFDDLLLRRAGELGASIYEETTVTALTNSHSWKVETTSGEDFAARTLVGADGRNSTVARLCNLLPRPERERIALQSHLALPANFGNSAVLQFLPNGYSGLAPVNDLAFRRITPGEQSHRLLGTRFRRRTKIYCLSAMPPAWWSRLPEKEFIMLFAPANWRRRQSSR